MSIEADSTMMMVSSKVVHPGHYNQGPIECWDFVVSHKMGFLEGNIVKYLCRYQHKNGIEDLLKAREYLNKLIEVTRDQASS